MQGLDLASRPFFVSLIIYISHPNNISGPCLFMVLIMASVSACRNIFSGLPASDANLACIGCDLSLFHPVDMMTPLRVTAAACLDDLILADLCSATLISFSVITWV